MKIKDYPVTKIFTELSLYQPLEFDSDDEYKLKEVYAFDGKIDFYCNECGKESTYSSYLNEENSMRRNHVLYGNLGHLTSGNTIDTKISYLDLKEVFTCDFVCARSKEHSIHFMFIYDNYKLTKIGQYPSNADLFYEKNKKYNKILEKNKFNELLRAEGLFSHGIGIGSFVYLRRILENLIEKYHMIASKNNPDWNEAKYLECKIKEKIRMLRDFLPAFFIENVQLYSILSKGIHELSEKECLEYYPVIKVSIELILDEELQKKEREIKIRETKKGIDRIVSGNA